jgi:hypothetical protein
MRWMRSVSRFLKKAHSRIREARLALPGAFWAALLVGISLLLIVWIVMSGRAEGVWAAYHSNRKDITPLATFGTAIGVIIGAGITLIRHFAQTEADRQRRIVESFSKAVEQLGSDKLEVRVGAIFGLERLSRESPRDYWTIMEVLSAFVRDRMRYTTIIVRLSERAYFLWLQAGRPEGRSEEFWADAVRLEQLEQTPTDVAAVLTVIRRRSAKNRQREEYRGWQLDLRGTYFRRAELWGIHLERAILGDAHLEGARLSHAHLEGAHLSNAHLEGAFLNGAHLEGADLFRAHLEGAFLWRAHLEGAQLPGAHLEGAFLHEAHLKGANLYDAGLEGADLNEAHLEGANLGYAKGLKEDQLVGSFGDPKTELPWFGVTRPKGWPIFLEMGIIGRARFRVRRGIIFFKRRWYLLRNARTRRRRA